MSLTIRSQLRIAAFFIATLFFQPAFAGLYAEVQGRDMEYEIDYSNGEETYEVDPIIVKLGLASEAVDGAYGAIELHLIGDSDDTILDPFNTLFRTDIDTSIGLAGKYGCQGERLGLYLQISMTSLDTTYTRVASSTSDSDKVFLLGGGIGISFKIIENLRITADHTHSTGEASYPTFITRDPDITFSGASIGINLQF